MYDVEATFVLQRPATSFLQVAYWASSWVALLGRPPGSFSRVLQLPTLGSLSSNESHFVGEAESISATCKNKL